MAKQTFTASQVLTAAQMNTLQTNDYNQTVSTKTASYTLVATDAGTRVVMNSASATTITVNTSLFTAGDTLEINNIGAGVCTVTAGTATVSSAGTLFMLPNGGGRLLFVSASASIWFPSAVNRVLQVVSSTQTTNIQNNTNTYADTGLSVSITPSSSSSKVLIIGSNSLAKNSTNANSSASSRLVRGATTISQISQGVLYTNSAIYNVGNDQFFFLDSPATTSATTYKTQFNSQANNDGVIVNINIGGGNQTSYIVALEISA
jgi:hypothetical protein